MNKREARLARDAERVTKNALKSARFKEIVAAPEARLGFQVEGKSVRAGADPNSVFQMQMTWTAEMADCEGAWRSGTARQWSSEDWDGKIHPKLAHWRQLMWWEIERQTTDSGRRMHHPMPVETIANEAVQRLCDLDLNCEIIYRFRLGNRQRLWGFREVANFEILWFDPNHEIYPTDVD